MINKACVKAKNKKLMKKVIYHLFLALRFRVFLQRWGLDLVFSKVTTGGKSLDGKKF